MYLKTHMNTTLTEQLKADINRKIRRPKFVIHKYTEAYRRNNSNEFQYRVHKGVHLFGRGKKNT